MNVSTKNAAHERFYQKCGSFTDQFGLCSPYHTGHPARRPRLPDDSKRAKTAEVGLGPRPGYQQ
jgi:hypothetical protein